MKLQHALAGLIVAGGLAAGSLSASAAPLTASPAAANPGITVGSGLIEEVHYRRYHHRHRGWNRGHRGPSIYFGFGPRWGYGHRRHWRHRGW